MSILNFRNLPRYPPGGGYEPNDPNQAINALNRMGRNSGLMDILEAGMRFTPGGMLATSFAPQQGRITGPQRSIADLIGRLPTGKAGSGLTSNRPASIEDIIAKLESLQDPGRYSIDPELLERQARATAAAQYDPVISQLRNQAGVATGRANRNKEQLGSMFSGLSQSLMNDVAPIQQQYANTKQQTANQYTDLQNQLKQQYSNSQAEQEAMLRRLNIEAAAPDVVQGQQSDRDLYLANAATEAQNVQSQLSQQEGGAVNYTRQGAELARTEGTNRQADLMANLSDYLSQVEGQIGSNEAAKQQAYIAQLAGLQTNAQESAVKNSQRDFENYIKVLSVMQSLQGNQQKPSPVKSLGDVAGRALGLGLDPGSSQSLQNIFMSALSSDPVIQSGLDPKFGVSLTEEALANRVVEAGRNQGLSQPQLNALQQIALEYFGRR